MRPSSWRAAASSRVSCACLNCASTRLLGPRPSQGWRLPPSRFPEVGLEDEGGESGGDGSSDKPREGRWRKRCRAFCEANELSERQAEVLVLIAQGRSIEHVSQQLFISTSTVQTHVRNIYRKTGVHSRTELVDEIEATKLYGEE